MTSPWSIPLAHFPKMQPSSAFPCFITTPRSAIPRRGATLRDESLSQSDLTVFRDLARQVGIALYAAQSTDDLQRARIRLVTAREEERRRIRRDLHDGLGPMLANFAMQLEQPRKFTC